MVIWDIREQYRNTFPKVCKANRQGKLQLSFMPIAFWMSTEYFLQLPWGCCEQVPHLCPVRATQHQGGRFSSNSPRKYNRNKTDKKNDASLLWTLWKWKIHPGKFKSTLNKYAAYLFSISLFFEDFLKGKNRRSGRRQ